MLEIQFGNHFFKKLRNKKKRFFRPTDPNIFRNVTGNTHIFLGLRIIPYASIITSETLSHNTKFYIKYLYVFG